MQCNAGRGISQFGCSDEDIVLRQQQKRGDEFHSMLPKNNNIPPSGPSKGHHKVFKPPAEISTQGAEAMAAWLLRIDNSCRCGSMVDIILDCPGFQSSWISPGQETIIVNGDGTCALPDIRISPFQPHLITYHHATMSAFSIRRIVWKSLTAIVGF